MKPSRARQLLVAVSLGVALVTAGCTGGDGEPTAEPTGATSSSPAPGVPTVPAGPPASTATAIGTSTQPPVEVGQEAAFGDGLKATVTGLEDVTLSAQGPGEVAGPGVAVRMTLENGTGERVDLGGVVVSTTFSGGAPGDISTSAPSDVPTGLMEPGATAEGVWVFSRPAGASGAPEVSVSSVSSSAVVVIKG